MKFKSFTKSVVKIKYLQLLGETSHAKLSPPYRLKLAEQMKQKAKYAKQAAVMALFYPNANNETHLVLILRKTYKGVHSAQVGFPGGKYETTDKDFMQTALRETEEEIGVSTSAIEVIKTLSPIYIPPSNFRVHPFLGISQKQLHFKKQDEEVDAIIEVNFDDFMNDKHIISTKVSTSYNVSVNVPAFYLNGHIVWGATAMMLGELKDLLKQIF